MANKVANVNDVTEAIGGVAVAERPDPRNVLPGLSGLQDLHNVPTEALRSHLRQLPEASPVIAEAPLIETDTAPGFSALHQLTVGRGPIADISVDPSDGLVYVANHVDDSVAVLDPVTLGPAQIISGVTEAFAIQARNGRAYVSTVTGAHDAVTVIDTLATSEPVTHPVSMAVRALTVSADGRYVYAARTGRDGADVAVIDTADGQVVTIDLKTRVEASAEAITMSRDGSRLYVVTADHIGGEFIAIDTRSRRVLGGLAFPSPLRDVVAGPAGTVFVASGDSADGGIVDIVDTRSLRVVDSIHVGGAVTQLMVNAEGSRLYVVNGDRISVICPATHEIVDTITVVAEPSCIAESADGKRLFIADYTGGVTLLTVASSTESLLAKMMAADIIDVPMLELERATV